MGDFNDKNPLFLDHMATTPLAPEVSELLNELHRSQIHTRQFDRESRIETAKQQVAQLVGAKADEVIFTSGATEANNLALMGATPTYALIMTTAIEHSSVLEPLKCRQKTGTKISFLPLREDGTVDLEKLPELLEAEKPSLISVQGTNNEMGIRQPLKEIGALCRCHGVLFHVDAAQAIIGQGIDIEDIGADLLSLSAHKFYGPQGIGALIVRRGLSLSPLLMGGGQQYGLRAGTLPAASIITMGAAADIANEQKKHDFDHLNSLKNTLLHILIVNMRDLVKVHSSMGDDCHPGLISLAFGDIPAEDIMAEVPELTLGTGAACNAATGKPSHVLKALGKSAIEIHSTLRIGLGRYVTKAEVEEAAIILVQGAKRLVSENVSP